MELIKKPSIKKTVLMGQPVYVAISEEKIAMFYRPESARGSADAAHHRALKYQTA